MTIDERLYILLSSGSPMAIPAVGHRWYAQSAPKNSPKPYGVYQLVGAEGIRIHDNRESDTTKRWHFQFAVYGPDRTVVKLAAAQLKTLFLQTADSGPGIQSIVYQNQHDDEIEVEQLYGSILEFVIWENL